MNCNPQTLLTPVLVSLAVTNTGVRSIWYGPYKQAERTDAGIAYPGSTPGQLVLGTGNTTGRNWSGNISAGYVWNRALTDNEIVWLAADPFAPVRGNKLSLASLAYGAGGTSLRLTWNPIFGKGGHYLTI